MNTKKTLDAISHCYDDCSDYKIAQMMEVTRQQVSRWRTGKETMSEQQRIKVAELLKQEPIEQLIHGRLERAKCTDSKKVWQQHLERLTAAGASLVFAFVIFFQPVDVEARTLQAAENDTPAYTLCEIIIMSCYGPSPVFLSKTA